MLVARFRSTPAFDRRYIPPYSVPRRSSSVGVCSHLAPSVGHPRRRFLTSARRRACATDHPTVNDQSTHVRCSLDLARTGHIVAAPSCHQLGPREPCRGRSGATPVHRQHQQIAARDTPWRHSMARPRPPDPEIGALVRNYGSIRPPIHPRLAALLLPRILTIFSVGTPDQPGASPASAPHRARERNHDGPVTDPLIGSVPLELAKGFEPPTR